MTEEDILVRVILIIRDGLTNIVDQLNDVLAALAPETRIPRIDLGDLDQAGWVTYRTKVPASPGSAAWLKNPEYFTDYEPPQVVFELVNAIKRSPGEKLVLGDCEYSFSGGGKFISRKPVKVK